MSTAGKVLSVLIVLVSIAWILLSAAAAELNRNGAKSVDALRVQVDKLEADFARLEADLQALKDNTYLEQLKTQNDLTDLQARQSEVEKARSQAVETLKRVQYQSEGRKGILAGSQKLNEERLAEKQAETKALEDARASVETLKSENTTLLATLTGLRDQFKSKLEENKGMVERMNKGTGATSRRASMAPAR